MGDIDILIKPEGREKARKTMVRNGYRNPFDGATHDVYFKDNSIHVEIHPQIDTHLEEAHLKALGDVWADAVPIAGSEYELDTSTNLLYIICHLAKHLKSSGIGIRQILDVGVMLTKMDDKIDRARFFGLLDESGLRLFFDHLVYINKKYFDFPIDEAYLAGYVPDNGLIEEMLDYFIASGVHGKAPNFNQAVPALTKISSKEGRVRFSKTKYLFHVAFPTYKDMAATRKYLHKHPYLLPYAWMSRWYDLMFKKTRRSIAKLKALKVDPKELEAKRILYEKMGL